MQILATWKFTLLFRWKLPMVGKEFSIKEDRNQRSKKTKLYSKETMKLLNINIKYNSWKYLWIHTWARGVRKNMNLNNKEKDNSLFRSTNRKRESIYNTPFIQKSKGIWQAPKQLQTVKNCSKKNKMQPKLNYWGEEGFGDHIWEPKNI